MTPALSPEGLFAKAFRSLQSSDLKIKLRSALKIIVTYLLGVSSFPSFVFVLG